MTTERLEYAKVIADSISPQGDRVTTMEVTFVRWVLAEMNTHRTFSRNSASSRAIPVHKQIKKVKESPAIPLVWPAEQKGMQGGADLEDWQQTDCLQEWLHARDAAVHSAEALIEAGLHKSVINRILEPFMWQTAIISATEWQGFFAQRCSPLAQPEFRVVAEMMKEAYDNSTPVELDYGDWHVPYVDEETWLDLVSDMKDPVMASAYVSSARCARVSHLTQDGHRDVEVDLDLYYRLCHPGDGPPHMSPLEHPCTPRHPDEDDLGEGLGNFVGWNQLRHMVFKPHDRY